MTKPDAQGVFQATLNETINAYCADTPAVKHHSQSMRAFANIIVGGGMGNFGVQMKSLSDLVKNSEHDCVQLSCLVPESAFPALTKLLELDRAIKVLPGTKDPELLETYRLTVVVQLPGSVDKSALADKIAALAQSILSDAIERLQTAGYGDQLSRGIKPLT